MDAVNCEALTNAVARLAPFTSTTELGMKLLPVRVSVNPGLPAETLEGEMLESEGTGLFTVLTGRVTTAPAPPPGVVHDKLTDRRSPAVRADANRVAVNCVAL